MCGIWLQEDERLREEKDERKRKYNVTYSNDVSDVFLSFVAVSFLAEVWTVFVCTTP